MAAAAAAMRIYFPTPLRRPDPDRDGDGDRQGEDMAAAAADDQTSVYQKLVAASKAEWIGCVVEVPALSSGGCRSIPGHDSLGKPLGEYIQALSDGV